MNIKTNQPLDKSGLIIHLQILDVHTFHSGTLKKVDAISNAIQFIKYHTLDACLNDQL